MTATVVDPRTALHDAIEREFDGLRRAVELYVLKMGLAHGRDAVAAAAEDVLQEVVARALRRIDAFDPQRPALAWLRGFAINVIKEQRSKLWDRRQHEAEPARPTEDDGEEPEPLERIFDLLGEDQYRVVELLDLVEPAERELLRLRYVDGLDGRALAEKLGIREGAARVRLSRALVQMRAAFHRREDELRGSTSP